VAAKRKTNTKKDLEAKIAQLEAKLTKLATQIETKPPEPKPAETKPPEPKPAETKPPEPKPADTKPAEPKKDTLPKGSQPKPTEVQKPAETAKQPPATFNEALEDAYYTSPMSDYHKYRASVPGYSPRPNRYYVRLHAPVGKVPTTNWNDQKAAVTGYTAPSNQYFATRQRLAYHPADKTFGSFSSVAMTVEGVSIQEKKQEPPKEAPKPEETAQSPPPSTTNTQSQSKAQQLEEYEKNYMQRLEQEEIEQKKAYEEQVKIEAAEVAAKSQSSAGSARGSLPKGFEAKPEPEKPKSSKGTLPKGF
jgi:hypothetical protein